MCKQIYLQSAKIEPTSQSRIMRYD